MMKKIAATLKVPNFELSTSRYYLLKPLYNYENETYPRIISYFSSDDLEKVYVPKNEFFT